jgi:hypothetical protein
MNNNNPTKKTHKLNWAYSILKKKCKIKWIINLIWLFDLDTILERGPDSISQKNIYLDCFDVLILKINLKNIILIYF